MNKKIINIHAIWILLKFWSNRMFNEVFIIDSAPNEENIF